MIIWSAISSSLHTGIFLPLMARTMQDQSIDEQNERAFLATAIVGIGEIFGGVFIGAVRDYTQSYKVAFVFEIILMVSALTTVWVFNSANSFSWVAYLMSLLMGLQDSGLNCLMRCILGFEFDSKVTPFSVFNCVQSLAKFAFDLIGSSVMNPSFDDAQS